jgi:hypothetical protein
MVPFCLHENRYRSHRIALLARKAGQQALPQLREGFGLRAPVRTSLHRNASNCMARQEEAPPGFEPGMADLQSAAVALQASTASATSGEGIRRLDRASTKLFLESGPPDHDLARILAAWPGLPPAIRRAILALVGSGK